MESYKQLVSRCSLCTTTQIVLTVGRVFPRRVPSIIFRISYSILTTEMTLKRTVGSPKISFNILLQDFKVIIFAFFWVSTHHSRVRSRGDVYRTWTGDLLRDRQAFWPAELIRHINKAQKRVCFTDSNRIFWLTAKCIILICYKILFKKTLLYVPLLTFYNYYIIFF